MSDTYDESQGLVLAELGPTGAGKTTMLACMNNKFNEHLGGFFKPDSMNTQQLLEGAYNKLKNEANGSKSEFSVDVGGTDSIRKYPFKIGDGLNVRFVDFPGGWMMTDSEEQQEVIKIIKSSRVIFVAINAPYIMTRAKNEKQKENFYHIAGVDSIGYLLSNHLPNDMKHRLIIFVPIKCEEYRGDDKKRKALQDKVKDLYIDKVLHLVDTNPNYKDSLSVAYMPIHTVGNAAFSGFKMDGDEVVGEVYRRSNRNGFSPKNAEMPFLYAMNFLMNVCVREDDAQLRAEFAKSNMASISERIFDLLGSLEKDDDFKIFCGSDLLTSKPPIPKPVPPKKPDDDDNDGDKVPPPPPPIPDPWRKRWWKRLGLTRSLMVGGCAVGAVGCGLLALTSTPFFAIGAIPFAGLAVLSLKK